MSYTTYLQDLLRPLGVYDLNAPLQGGELECAGAALDEVEAFLEEIHREICLATAESWGLERVSALMEHPPLAPDPAAMSAALAALLRIGGDSFTLAAINDTLAGCGIPARAEEVAVGEVKVWFPEQAGPPDNFDYIQRRIQGLLPAHLDVKAWLRFITWAELEQQFATWSALEGQIWEELELKVIW